MSEKKKEKKGEKTERIILKRETSGVERRPRIGEAYEQSGVERRTTEKKKKKEK